MPLLTCKEHVACEQAFHLGDTVKSRRAEARERRRESGGWGEKGELLSSAPRGFDDRSRVLAQLEFARPNRRACSQAKEYVRLKRLKLRYQPFTKGFVQIFGSKIQDFFQTFFKAITSFYRL